MINYLEKALLLNFSIFLIFAPYSKRVVKVCFVVGVSLWLLMNILRLKYRQRRAFPNPLNKPLLIFLAAAFLSTIFSLNFYHSQSIFFERYLPYAIFFWIGIYESSTLKNLYFLIGIFMLSGIIFGLGGVWDYLHFHPYRLFTVFGREIPFKMFGLYLAYYIPLSFALVLSADRRRASAEGGSASGGNADIRRSNTDKCRLCFRIGGIVSLILLIPCWIWQGSRTAWIAVILSLFIISLVRNKKKLILILLLILVVCFSISSRYTQRRVESILHLNKWPVRIELWRTAENIFKDFPVFGAGLGMDEKLLYEYAPPESYSKRHGWRCGHVHSTYLEILSEMGIIGLLAFLGIFVVFFKNVFKTIRNITGNQQVILLGLTGTIIATLIFALSSSIITVGTHAAPMFWFLFGMASGLISKD